MPIDRTRYPGVIGPDPHPDDAVMRAEPSAVPDRSPWYSPQHVRGNPQTLPPPGDRIQPRTTTLIGRTGIAGLANPQVPNNMVREAHRYASPIEIPFSLDANTSTMVLQLPTGLRNFLMFRATETTNGIYISFGTSASLSSILRLTANQMAMFDTVVPQTEVFAYCPDDPGVLTIAFANYSPNL